MDKVIDIQNWTRKEEYLFFRTFLNPMISVTVEVDCTTAYRKAKERQQPFSLYYMHAAVTAANRIEEFRYRQVGEEVILYERIDLFTPVQNADGSYRSVRLPAIETFEDSWLLPGLLSRLQSVEKERYIMRPDKVGIFC